MQSFEHQMKMSNTTYFKSLICVGENQFYQLIDSPIKNKIFHINNGIPDNLIENNQLFNKFESRKDIVFMGSLVPQKNFDYLAKLWKLISFKIPDAKLHVIGSSNTYGINNNLGKRGLAEKKYEAKFLQLLNLDPQSAKKVYFHGNLGLSKYELLSKARVGIVNPLGTTETCCVSAVEMQALGLPVCTGNYESLKTTVLDKISGLLSISEKQFVENIIKIYTSKELFEKLSNGARANAKFNFSINKVSIQWYELFYRVKLNIEVGKSFRADKENTTFNILFFIRKINAIIFQDKLRIKSISTNHLIYLIKQVIRPFYKFLKLSIFK